VLQPDLVKQIREAIEDQVYHSNDERELTKELEELQEETEILLENAVVDGVTDNIDYYQRLLLTFELLQSNYMVSQLDQPLDLENLVELEEDYHGY